MPSSLRPSKRQDCWRTRRDPTPQRGVPPEELESEDGGELARSREILSSGCPSAVAAGVPVFDVSKIPGQRVAATREEASVFQRERPPPAGWR